MAAQVQIDERRIEAVDPLVAECLRRAGMVKRVAMTGDSNETIRAVIRAHLHWRHPDWDGSQVEAEIARRMHLDTA